MQLSNAAAARLRKKAPNSDIAPTPATLNGLVAAALAAGEAENLPDDEVLSVVTRRAEQLGVAPNERTFNQLMWHFFRRGDKRRGYLVLREWMPQHGVKPSRKTYS